LSLSDRLNTKGGMSASLVRKIAAAKARAGREFPFPKTLFFPAPPERRFPAAPQARQSVNFVQNRFGFGCINAPVSNFQEFYRQIRRRFAPPCTGKWVRRAQRGSPKRGSYPLRFLNICFAQLKINQIIL